MASGTDPSQFAETAVQGKVVGFIRPPPDIRVIVDKTAAFIAKYGDHMESKIMEKEAGNLKFGFLKIDDPYNGYYKHKVAELRAQAAAPPAETPSQQADKAVPVPSTTEQPSTAPVPPAVQAAPTGVTAAERTAEAGLPNPLSKALKSFDPEKPGIADEFHVPAPAGATPLELDTITLTAQYTAVGGKDFLRQLSSREFRNSVFDFLRPSHPLFNYYTALVDAYSKILSPSPVLKDRVAAQATSSFVTLERGVHRLEYGRVEAERKKAEQAETEALASALASIDWHDFVVVETIHFPVDEDLSEAAAAAEEQAAAEQSADMDTGEDMDLGDTTGDASRSVSAGAGHVEGGEALNIRTDYVPQVATAGATNAPSHFIDPRTGQAIPISTAAQHLRYDLLDPKWKEETARAQAKQATTLFASGDVITDNLRRLAQQRQDVFRDEETSAPTVAVVAGPSLPSGGQPKRARHAE